MDAAIGFTDAFSHLRTGAPCGDRIGLLNVLLAEGLNLGLRKMAEASNTHDYWQLSRSCTPFRCWKFHSSALFRFPSPALIWVTREISVDHRTYLQEGGLDLAIDQHRERQASAALQQLLFRNVVIHQLPKSASRGGVAPVLLNIGIA